MGFLFLNDERKRKPHPLQRGGWGKVCLKVTQPLGNEDAAWVGGCAAEEGEEQIQSWKVKDLHMRAAAWACAGKYVCNAIAITIVDCNARTACEVFCVGIKLRK